MHYDHNDRLLLVKLSRKEIPSNVRKEDGQ